MGGLYNFALERLKMDELNPNKEDNKPIETFFYGPSPLLSLIERTKSFFYIGLLSVAGYGPL